MNDMTANTEIGNPLFDLGIPTGLFIDMGELVSCATECRNSFSNNVWLGSIVWPGSIDPDKQELD